MLDEVFVVDDERCLVVCAHALDGVAVDGRLVRVDDRLQHRTELATQLTTDLALRPVLLPRTCPGRAGGGGGRRDGGKERRRER